ncbi:MAG TPA: SDR family oxidoreductase [Myxococcales bacterium]|nr:SDR family oxidoreductase [Myxococcales bacterium]
MERVLVLGATSAIAQQVARLYAARRASLFLVARNPERLNAVADDLRVRGGSVETVVANLDDPALHADLIARAAPLQVVLLAHGVLGDPQRTGRDARAAIEVLETNLIAPVSLLTQAAQRMEEQRSGCLVALSSVAGDRGRASNAVYGASKAGLTAFLSGLRNRLSRTGVRVVTVKPGFVDTPMTAHLPKNPLYASPERVARDVVRAIDRGRDVVYTPWWWRFVMLVIRLIPERIFKRLSL